MIFFVSKEFLVELLTRIRISDIRVYSGSDESYFKIRRPQIFRYKKYRTSNLNSGGSGSSDPEPDNLNPDPQH